MAVAVVVRREGPVARVLLDRPSTFNAFDLPMVEEFAGHIGELAVDETVRGIVIGSEGRAFCTGGDLKWAAAHERGAAAAFHLLAGRFHQAVVEIRRMPKPVIAAIGGVAAGGGFSLALACDFRVMARSAVLRQAYTSSGLCIDGGGTATLPRLVGLARALEIAAFDPPISADQAHAWGLVTRVVDDGRALDDAVALAAELAGRSLHAYGWAKQLLFDSSHTPFEAQLERERCGLATCAAHPDGQEGLRAFREKRAPSFG